MFPDIGASKRYSNMFSEYKKITTHKERDFKTGKIKSMKILENIDINSRIKGKNIIIVDDLCSKGGTFILAAESLKNLGCNDIYLAVAHCENTIFEGDIFKTNLIKQVYTTNTIVNKNKETDRLIIREVI
jgi:ribose-phosphate pyrophosphokinase